MPSHVNVWALASDSRADRLLDALEARGYGVRRHRRRGDLQQALSETGWGVGTVVLLFDADVVENCLCAYALDAIPGLRLMALAGPHLSDAERDALLRAGVQRIVAGHQDADDIVGLIDVAAMRGSAPAPAPAGPGAAIRVPVPRPSAARQTGLSWSVAEQGWVLIHESGLRWRLTPAERAFLAALLAAGRGREVPNDKLIEAVRAARLSTSRRVRQTYNLHLLVTRLRSKTRKNGLEVPVRVVFGVGYVWVGA